MDINNLIAIVKKKLNEKIIIEKLEVEDKSSSESSELLLSVKFTRFSLCILTGQFSCDVIRCMTQVAEVNHVWSVSIHQ